MEENFNQQNKSSVPPPPPPEIALRTMKSDIKSIEQGGGEIMAPKTFSPFVTKTEKPEIEAEIGVPGYTGPEQSIFASPARITKQEVSGGKTMSWKFILLIIGILLLVGIFWFLGYYVISPWLFS